MESIKEVTIFYSGTDDKWKAVLKDLPGVVLLEKFPEPSVTPFIKDEFIPKVLKGPDLNRPYYRDFDSQRRKGRFKGR